ncbi:MAG TPA: amino acid permease [Gemmatimonadaceae bacterium]|jgi:APA family basic amino acid/polyamine antiporter|nr:amino acid permease [Gemmatimonadaceae bacterium]
MAHATRPAPPAPALTGTTGAVETLPRQLGLWSAIAVVVGITIGSGIFRTPASVTNRLPGPLPVFGVWIAGGIVAMCGALTLAEVAAAFPDTGGIFVFIRKSWGRLPAFLFGWAELAIIRAAAVGAIATTFAEYLLRVLGFDPGVAPYDSWVHYVAAVAIAVIAAFNYVGLRWGSLIQNVTAVAKYFGLLFIVVAAIVVGIPKTGGYFTPMVPPGSFSIAPFGLALVSVLWAYDGWADLAFISGEVKDPARNLPRALIFGTLAVIAIYLLANVAYMGVMPVGDIRHSKLVAADVALRLIGPAGVTFIALTVMLSTLGTLNGSILTNPRVFFAMAADGLLFRKIADVHPRFKTPYVAIALTAVLGIIFVLLRTFEQLADSFVTAILPFYALGVASIFVFRRRTAAEYSPPFRAPLYPIAPILFVLATLYLLVNALIDPSSRWATLAIFGVILAGIPVYYATVGGSAARAAAE